MKIKICGMRDPANIIDIAELGPDMMGFIFFRISPRFAGDILDPGIMSKIRAVEKVGVFVNEDPETIKKTVKKYSLDIVQLHGSEDPRVCRNLISSGVKVIKSFSVSKGFDFALCDEYVDCADYFLFDTASAEYGGSGSKFDWKVLDKYRSGIPFLLSGGISPDDLSVIADISMSTFAGIDINSRFEENPGYKNVDLIRNFTIRIRDDQKKNFFV